MMKIGRLFSVIFATYIAMVGIAHSKEVAVDFATLEHFGENPGELTASYFAYNAPEKPLVVLLHGCVQNGQTLANKSGLLGLAKSHQFNLLVPQQNSNNNIKDCFNWFSTLDTSENSGELLSLKNIILTAKQRTRSDAVYIMGLSAGGAMTSALLSIYPEIFTAGAIISGVPFPCADSLTKAISCMRTGPSQSPKALAAEVKKLNNRSKQWPYLSIWSGTNDQVVNVKNSYFLAQQWASLHQLTEQATTSKHQGFEKKIWRNKQNQTAIELILIDGIGHGMTVNSSVKHGGHAGPYLLNSVLPSAREIIKFWQLKD